MPSKETMRVPEYADRKKVSAAQIRNWFHAGILPGIQINRTILLDPVECDASLEQFKRPGKPRK
jgi:hypothetical protein